MNETSMHRWYLATQKRCSIRKYNGDPTADDVESLKEFAQSISGDEVRIVIAKGEDVFKRSFGARIIGTDCFAAIIARDGNKEMAGYIGELFILECVARGFGTCWLGASFKMSEVQKLIPRERNEKIVAITPIGIPGEPYKRKDRKPVTDMTDLNARDYLAKPDWQKCAIECVRIAPSAANNQPWAFDFEGDDALVLYKYGLGWFGYSDIDMGIAMLHVELGAGEYGVYGDWSLGRDENIFKVNEDI